MYRNLVMVAVFILLLGAIFVALLNMDSRATGLSEFPADRVNLARRPGLGRWLEQSLDRGRDGFSSSCRPLRAVRGSQSRHRVRHLIVRLNARDPQRRTAFKSIATSSAGQRERTLADSSSTAAAATTNLQVVATASSVSSG
jgi:hypothetical protein